MATDHLGSMWSEDSNPMWIESHQSLGRHPKTKRLARKLGVSIPCTIGHLHLLWWWALDYAQDGDISNFEPLEIADEMMWTGDPDDLISALKDAEFLDFEPSKLTIHDWDDYAGKLLEQRARHAEVMRQQRIKRKEVTLPSRDNHAAVTVLATVPNLTVPNQPNKTEQNLPPAAACAADLFDEFAARIEATGANAGAVLADAVSNQYGLECRDYGRLGKLAKDHGPTAVLDRIFGLTATWSGKGNPVNYIIAAMNGSAKDRKNGHSNGHLPEKLPTNHQPTELPEVIDWEALGGALPNAEEEETAEDRRIVREHEYRLRADSAYGLWWEDVEPLVEQGKPFRPAPPWPSFLPRPDWMAEPVGMK